MRLASLFGPLSRRCATGLLLASGLSLWGNENSSTSPPIVATPERVEAGAESTPLSAEERRARLKELREQREKGIAPWREEFEKRREALKSLPPMERKARLQSLRAEMDRRREEWKSLPPEERAPWMRRPLSPEQRELRKRVRARLDLKITELRQKQSNGTASDAEREQLRRLELIARTPAAPPPQGPVP